MISQILPHFVWYFFSGVALTNSHIQNAYLPSPYVPVSQLSENTHTITFLHFRHHTHYTHTTHGHSILYTHSDRILVTSSEPKTTDSFCTSDITHTHTENTQHTHTIITLHPLTQNPTTSCLLPSHYLKRQQTSQSVLIFYWSREMATNTQRPSLCCSLLPRITRSTLLRT